MALTAWDQQDFSNLESLFQNPSSLNYINSIARLRNEEVRSRTGVVELGQKLRGTRLRWLGHIMRREESYAGRRMRNLVVGRRRRGRPKRRWQDCIDDDLRVIARKEEDALGRKEWRRIIRTCDPNKWE